VFVTAERADGLGIPIRSSLVDESCCRALDCATMFPFSGSEVAARFRVWDLGLRVKGLGFRV
jgi:hypothetical protein